jgi:hypothetical protein
MTLHSESDSGEFEAAIQGIVGQRLSLEAFHQLSGTLGGYPFVKTVVDRTNRDKPVVHFINNELYQFHSDYIAEQLLDTPRQEVDKRIDEFNQSVYISPERNFLLGTVAFHRRGERFFTLETVELDAMDSAMVQEFYAHVQRHLDRDYPLYFKPANHGQEDIANAISKDQLPRVFAHQLFSTANYLPLNPGTSRGRIRIFDDEKQYKAARPTLEWYDIIVMERVPDDIPRLAGIVNAAHTTPLSHTNVLASGWQIPNCVQIGVIAHIRAHHLENNWVEFVVDVGAEGVRLAPVPEPPATELVRPAWAVQRIVLEEPETLNVPLAELSQLRLTDRFRYGTKAANLGELMHVLEQGSERLLGFYRIRRPPRANLMPYISKYLGLNETEAQDTALLSRRAVEFLRQTVRVPHGVALPFSLNQEFLESSPRIQQALGKLKMALELNAREVESTCLTIMGLIRQTRMSDRMRESIDSLVANSLAGVSSFVVRSSSNAEDLENFSAAGIYESYNHQTSAENIFNSIKEVWASLVSPRSVRLRQEVGISMDACWMGVIIQEELPARAGGVLVTSNPLNPADFRNVYINVSTHSVDSVMKGVELPLQYLYNTVEGGGRTLSLGSASEDLPTDLKEQMQKLAFAGRLLQSHFSPDYTFSNPVDIEWLVDDEGLVIVQLRPYSK